MNHQESVKHFVRVSIIELLRMNEIEEAIEAEKIYQIIYPGSYAYFPNIRYTEEYYFAEHGTIQEDT